MPPLKRSASRSAVLLPPRPARVAADTDVVVVGGGPAGLGAALGAAAAGAKVLVAERYGFLGGNATAALVMPLMSVHTERQPPRAVPPLAAAGRLLPDDHGPGEPVVAGVLTTLIERLVRAGGAIAPAEDTGFVVPFDPEIFKAVTIELLDEADVSYLMHSLASGVLPAAGATSELEAAAGRRRSRGRRDKGWGVVLETKSGPLVARGQVVIDCTGDGDVAAAAGADYEIGREADGLVQPMSLMFRLMDVERAAFQAYVAQHPDQWSGGVHGLWDLVKRAAAAGRLDLPREDILLFSTPRDREVAVNSTRVTQVLGVDVWDLTYAEWEARRQMQQIVAFLRRYVPGFARSYVIQSGSTVGVRETRRISGDYRLTAEDVLKARKFDDVIARGTYPIDIHDPRGKGTVLVRLPPGEAYDIPLRCLLPAGVEDILVAGRCISGSHEAVASYRIMPVSLATGQAAGVCAALAARLGVSPREVRPAEVQWELIRQGADLGQRPGVGQPTGAPGALPARARR